MCCKLDNTPGCEPRNGSQITNRKGFMEFRLAGSGPWLWFGPTLALRYCGTRYRN